jgi:predicted RNA-binding Zn-ribbon protein involved in translation (DUF1610 family)
MKFYKICPECDYFCRVEEKGDYCPNCGAKLIDRCKNCGEKIDNPYAEYCKNCGEKYRNSKKENTSNEFLF